MSDQAMPADCEHAYEVRMRGGEPVSVRICRSCGQPDWADLRQQIDALLLQRQYEVVEAFREPRPPMSPKEEAKIRETLAREGLDWPPVPAVPADPKERG